ncbi:hypothetical protein [Desulfogranum mediterraneum]|uniref:hypothetical protein n=1 Tax=Desulfogranum mediterraneum TaxID=160661 RepID=UPI0003FB3ECC|nr:hypothetical protein [Desulfogranum mediterraneum]
MNGRSEGGLCCERCQKKLAAEEVHFFPGSVLCRRCCRARMLSGWLLKLCCGGSGQAGGKLFSG